MRIDIAGLSELRQHLERLRLDETLARALAEQAQTLAGTVQAHLSEPPGGSAHDAPWRRTGALHDSIQSTASGLEAAIGSNDPAAAPQEMGTARIPPRPFLAPAASAAGDGIARDIGAATAAAIKPGSGE